MESVPSAPIEEPAVVEVKEKADDTVHKSLLNPELRLSRRQKEVLGIIGARGDLTPKQIERNKIAGDRLRVYHASKKSSKLIAEAERQRLFELENRVRLAGSKKIGKGRVRLKEKRQLEVSDEESDASEEVTRRVKKVSKTAKALEKLDETIARVAKTAEVKNPYLEAMLRRHF